MPYDVQRDSGMAERNSYVQIPSADFFAIPQGSSTDPCSARRYAQSVYVVGGDIGVDLSGSTIEVDTAALEAINTGISALTQDIYEKICVVDATLSAISGSTQIVAQNNTDYSSIIRVSGTDPSFTWIAKATPGSDPNDSVWQAKQIFEAGSDVDIQWANGSSTFTNPASALSALTYTY
jgi:hypothetical protein